MKFITEDELRHKYSREEFTEITLAPDERLTPGARQFLIDIGMDMYTGDRDYSKLTEVKYVKR